MRRGKEFVLGSLDLRSAIDEVMVMSEDAHQHRLQCACQPLWCGG
jgi:hypothetical protein